MTTPNPSTPDPVTGTGSPLRIGIGGPVGSGKTALIEALVPLFVDAGRHVGVITNDIYTQRTPSTSARNSRVISRTCHGGDRVLPAHRRAR